MMTTYELIIIILVFSSFAMLFAAMALLRKQRNGAYAMPEELLRRFSECLRKNELLERRVAELEHELTGLRAQLAEAESEIAALRALLVRLVRSDARIDQRVPIPRNTDADALREERTQLLRNIEQLRLHMAKYGEDLFVQNRIEAMQQRLAEIERLLDEGEGADEDADGDTGHG